MGRGKGGHSRGHSNHPNKLLNLPLKTHPPLETESQIAIELLHQMFQAVKRDEDQFLEIREEGDESNGEVDEIVNVSVSNESK